MENVTQGNNTVEGEPQEPTVVDQNGNAQSETTYNYGGKEWKSVSDLGKSYEELQSSYSKKLAGFDGAPENYTMQEGKEADSVISAIQGWGLENQLSQKGFDGLLEVYENIQKEQEETFEKEQEEAYNEALKGLGDNGNERLQNAQDFIKANFGEQYGEIVAPDGVEFVEMIMDKMKQPAPAKQTSTAIVDKDQIQAMRFAKDEHGNRRMSVDPDYRKKVEAAEAEFYGRSA